MRNLLVIMTEAVILCFLVIHIDLCKARDYTLTLEEHNKQDHNNESDDIKHVHHVSVM